MLSESFTHIGPVRAPKQFGTGRFRPVWGYFWPQDGHRLSFCKKGQESTEPHVGQCFQRVSHISGWYGPQNNLRQADWAFLRIFLAAGGASLLTLLSLVHAGKFLGHPYDTIIYCLRGKMPGTSWLPTFDPCKSLMKLVCPLLPIWLTNLNSVSLSCNSCDFYIWRILKVRTNDIY